MPQRRLLSALVGAAMAVVLLASPSASAGDGGPPGSPPSPPGLPGPPYQTSVAVLDRAVNCTPDIKGRKTVVLVPGTGMTVKETYGWGYERALPEAGFGVCTVELADRSLVSVYNQADYMVYAIRKARELSGRKVAVIGHSQGGSHPLWAMTFWPDVRAAVDDYIGLAPGVTGTRLGDVVCASGSCAAIAWQVRFGSTYINRLHEGGLPVGPSYTSIYTTFDEIVFPQPAGSHIPGGSNISVQSVCPLRVVEHATIVADSVAWALTIDALTHPGPADPSRLTNRLGLCLNRFMPRIDLVGMALGLASGGGHALTGLVTAPQVTAEPPLPDYAD
ncbi:lipase family alpha/beta hydrolase [Nocardioides limicola]|uniref:lipase family alpha/beta hydrolase n=1 Tax=Nocardioides limicola TaxID=2803368 RepID=UPI00193AF80F|nr:lipase [Nocardioides sp. DJM-14]